MKTTSRWPARIALAVSILMFGAIMGTFDAFGAPSGSVPAVLQTTASPSSSPSPSPSEECDIPLPAPPPICPSNPASPTASSTASPSASPSGPPDGDTEKNDSRVTIRYAAGGTPVQFKGAVKSVNKCEPKREVVLKRVQEGPNATIGRDTTNSSGAWSVAVPGAKGRYYAKLLKRVFMQGDLKVVCGPARSETLRVQP